MFECYKNFEPVLGLSFSCSLAGSAQLWSGQVWPQRETSQLLGRYLFRSVFPFTLILLCPLGATQSRHAMCAGSLSLDLQKMAALCDIMQCCCGFTLSSSVFFLKIKIAYACVCPTFRLCVCVFPTVRLCVCVPHYQIVRVCAPHYQIACVPQSLCVCAPLLDCACAPPLDCACVSLSLCVFRTQIVRVCPTIRLCMFVPHCQIVRMCSPLSDCACVCPTVRLCVCVPHCQIVHVCPAVRLCVCVCAPLRLCVCAPHYQIVRVCAPLSDCACMFPTVRFEAVRHVSIKRITTVVQLEGTRSSEVGVTLVPLNYWFRNVVGPVAVDRGKWATVVQLNNVADMRMAVGNELLE